VSSLKTHRLKYKETFMSINSITYPAIALLMSACLILFAPRLFAQGQVPKVKVKQVEFKNTEIRRIVTGNLRAYQRAEVASQVSGSVVKADTREGQSVKKGDVLAELDSRIIKLEIEQSVNDIQRKLAIIEQRKAEFVNYQEELNRRIKAQELADGAVSKENILRARKNVDVAKSAQTIAESDHKIAEVSLALLNIQLSDTTIRAPFDGTIIKKHTEAGEWVNPGNPIVTLISSGTIEASFEVPEHFSMQRLQTLESITVELKAQGIQIESKEITVIPDVNPRSRRYILTVVLNSKNHFLAPGMSVSAAIPISKKKDYLVIPADAVMRDSGGQFAYKISKGRDGSDIAIAISLREFFAVGDSLYIESVDLKKGDQIVVEGNERLRPMSPVSILGEK